MKIELRSVKLSVSLSQETPAYTATLFIDGKKAALIENHGQGGPDSVYWTDKGLIDVVDAHFKALPPISSHGFELPQDLELWAHTEVWAQQDMKRLKASSKRKLTAMADGALREWNVKPQNLTEKQRAQIVARYPDARFLHECGDTELRAILDADYAKKSAAAA